MRYVDWVNRVFDAVAATAPSAHGGVGLSQVAEALELGPLAWEDFAQQRQPAAALVTAMTDLENLGLLTFENVAHGNHLTPGGRDLASAGLFASLDPLWEISLAPREQAFLARLYEASSLEEARWADVAFVDTDPVLEAVGDAGGEYADVVRRVTFLGDLARKGLIRAESGVIGNSAYRPTFVAAALLTMPDPRFRARRAGVIDWSEVTPGFEEIEERLAYLKVALAAAVTDDDLSDIGRRCREIPADAVDVVFRPEMAPAGREAPSRQDAEERLALYLAARAPGQEHKELRKFLRASLELANARAHSARTGRAAAVASAQGLISFIRALQAVERSAGDFPKPTVDS